MQQGERVAEHGQPGRVAGEGLRLARQLGAARALLHRSCGEMIDDALDVRPGGERGRQRMVGVERHRAFEQVERARISLGIERQDAGHGPERQVVRAELAVRLLLGTIDLGEAQAGLKGRGDARRKMFAGSRVLADGAVGAVRPQVTAGIDLDQPKGQARLPAPSPHDAGQTVARRSRLARDGNACPRQRGGELVGHEAGDLGVLRAGFDRLQDDGQTIATGGEE